METGMGASTFFMDVDAECDACHYVDCISLLTFFMDFDAGAARADDADVDGSRLAAMT